MAAKRNTKRSRIVSKARNMIGGRMARGHWIQWDEDGETYDPSHLEGYERLVDDLPIRMKNRNEVPCTMCTEGALYLACATEGLGYHEAHDLVRTVERLLPQVTDYTGDYDQASIPEWNDHYAEPIEVERLLEFAEDTLAREGM